MSYDSMYEKRTDHMMRTDCNLSLAWLHPSVISKPKKTASFGVWLPFHQSRRLNSSNLTDKNSNGRIVSNIGSSRWLQALSSQITTGAQLSNPLLIPHSHSGRDTHTHTHKRRAEEKLRRSAVLRCPELSTRGKVVIEGNTLTSKGSATSCWFVPGNKSTEE